MVGDVACAWVERRSIMERVWVRVVFAVWRQERRRGSVIIDSEGMAVVGRYLKW